MNRCDVCGCTDIDACLDPETGEPCSWVEPDLCSVCARLPAALRAGAVLL